MSDAEDLRLWLTMKLRARELHTPAVHGVAFSGERRPTWDSVMNGFIAFTQPLEGLTRYMYADSLGFVTTGIGNLIDSDARGPDGRHAAGSLEAYGPALQLPWKAADGSVASQEQVISEWQLVKSSYPGVQSTADANITQLRLDMPTVENLVLSKVEQNETYLLEGFPGYGDYPADGQMVLLGMTWAMGGYFWKGFPQFTAAVNRQDWATAKTQGGFIGEAAQRKVAHNLLFDNAYTVTQYGMDRSKLYYPGIASPPSGKPGIGTAIAAVALAGGIAAGVTYRDEVGTFAKGAVKQVRQLANHVIAGKQRT